jgi:hypothetical protein
MRLRLNTLAHPQAMNYVQYKIALDLEQ